MPLLAYGSDKKFLGLLTVEKVLLERRYNPSTPISSCLINPPHLLRDTSPGKVIQMMSELKLYTLPLFDNQQKIVGTVTAKDIIINLMKNTYFASTLEEQTLKKNVVSIVESVSVSEAFHLFSKHNLSRLVVVDKNDMLLGVVSQRDIISTYLSPSSRERFSTRTHTKNYSLDIEKVKKDSQPISTYLTPILDTLSETLDSNSAIKSLLKSKHNSVILTNKQLRPIFVISMDDILNESVKIITDVPSLPTIISKLPKYLTIAEKKGITKELMNLSLWINKQERVQSVLLTTKESYSPQKKPIEFETRIEIFTDSHTYIAVHKDRDFFSAFRESIREVRKRVRRIG